MPNYQKCWRTDLSDVTPKERELARLAINLYQAAVNGEAKLAAHRSTRATWRLLAPVIEDRLKDKEGMDLEFDDENELEMLLESLDTEDDDDEEEDHLSGLEHLFNRIPSHVQEELQTRDVGALLTEVTKLLVSLLQLDETEQELLLFVELLLTSGALRNICRASSTGTLPVNTKRLAAALDLSEDSIQRALRSNSKLRTLALVKVDEHSDLEDCLKPGPVLEKAIAYAPRDREELLGIFLEPLGRAKVDENAFSHLETQVTVLKQVLGEAGKTCADGVNALFYGAPGTGKTELAKVIAKELAVQAYSVRSADESGEPMGREGRLGGYQLAQTLMGSAQAPLLVFDEMEDLQSTQELMLSRMTGYSPTREKGWFNRALESNPVPTIWITNDRWSLDPAVLRRFLLPVEFRTPPRSVREAIAGRILGDSGATDSLIKEVASDIAVTPAVLDNARRVVGLSPGANVDARVRHVLMNMRQAVRGRSTPRVRRSDTTLDLKLLNIEGTESPETVIRGIQGSGQGRLCLYGEPGTGKTQFAEILAEALDRELIVAQASDILNCYVGETEQNLAELFESADPEHAVLLLDEVDSFLEDRRNAQRSWERTRVNELLQQMERFPGVFIAATNLMDGLDPAALRRFDIKLMFRPMNASQRRRVFAQEAFGDPEAPVPETSARLLAGLEGLTLGDVANVCRQRRVLNEALVPEQFLRRLRSEWALKKAHGENSIPRQEF